MKLILNITLLLFISDAVEACSCKDKTLQQLDSISFENNAIVIVGTINKINRKNYKIKVEEVLKGNLISQSIIGIYGETLNSINYCSFYPRVKKGKYLLYLRSC